MAATSPAPMRAVGVAASAVTLAPSPSRLSLVSAVSSGRLLRCRAAHRWRPPRCRGKRAVGGVVEEEEDEEASREALKPEKKKEEAAETGLGVLGWFRLDEVGMDILGIAVPAALALAADPITALVDTAFVGHIGSVELAAVGVSISVFNLVNIWVFICTPLNHSGSVHGSAVVVALAAQGAFRGFMDTKTPLYAVVAGNLVNAILDAIFIFPLGLGVSGAALATVTSEYLAAFILLWKLNNELVLFSWNIIGGDIIRYLKSGALLIGRTIAVILPLWLSTSLAARQGPVPMAGYEISLQVWLTISLLNDALALAGQALLASEYAKGNYKQARTVVYRVLQIGGVTGVALAGTLFLGFGSLSLLFTDDPAVLDIARSGVWFVTISQPINAIAFVFDGLYYGVSDFAYAAYSTLFAGVVSSAFLLVVAPKFGLGGVWAGLVLFMGLRALVGFWRLGSKGGPWQIVWSETD